MSDLSYLLLTVGLFALLLAYLRACEALGAARHDAPAADGRHESR